MVLLKCKNFPPVIDFLNVFSSIGTFNYNYVHFLCNLLSPLVPNNYLCKDTFPFVSQTKNANLSRKFLVSYDVASLFTIFYFKKSLI